MNVRSKSGEASRALVATLLVAAFSTGCRGDEIERLLGKVSWFTNMRDQPAVEPMEEMPRTPPDGTVPVGAGIPLMASLDAYAALPNPRAGSEESRASGAEAFSIFCAVCHGVMGQGGGNIEGPFPAGLINRLDTERARGRSDGYLFGIITMGRGLMPNYRRIPQDVRWDIVNYVRSLQAR